MSKLAIRSSDGRKDGTTSPESDCGKDDGDVCYIAGTSNERCGARGTNSNDFTGKEHVLMQDKHGPSQASESDNQKRPNAESSTKTVNTARLVNTTTPTYADYPNDPLMPDLEDVGILMMLNDRYEVVEADNNNLETVISTLVDLTPGKRAIGTKWVYRNKRDQKGIVVRNKVRLVAQGHRQEEGIDYDEVFPPVARIESIGLFLAYALFLDFTIYQMDVKSVFYMALLKRRFMLANLQGLWIHSSQIECTRWTKLYMVFIKLLKPGMRLYPLTYWIMESEEE
nr:putative ribonuclease H-like domain-containing protein [Tanacetum cinerariifolium]